MTDWDALEEAGHDLTHCGMLMFGTSLYYCENCGAFMLAGQDGIACFHLPAGSGSTQTRCYFGEPPSPDQKLKAKLGALQTQDANGETYH